MVALEVGRRMTPKQSYERVRARIRREHPTIEQLADWARSLEHETGDGKVERSAVMDALREAVATELAVLVKDGDVTLATVAATVSAVKASATETADQLVAFVGLVDLRVQRRPDDQRMPQWLAEQLVRERRLRAMTPPPPGWVALVLRRAGMPVRWDPETTFYLNDLRDAYPDGWADEEYRRVLGGCGG